MSAIEEIQAAIDKLTELCNLPPVVVDFRATGDDNMDAWFERAEMKLAMFHRTIDAQIKLLSNTLDIRPKYAQLGMEARWISAVERAGDLDLARAINGKETK